MVEKMDAPKSCSQRTYDVEIWLKIGRQRRQRDINVILTSFCERWFNISIQTSKQRRYNVRRFDLKFRRCFNGGLMLSLVDEIGNIISTLFERRKSYVNPICIFNVGSTSIQCDQRQIPTLG